MLVLACWRLLVLKLQMLVPILNQKLQLPYAYFKYRNDYYVVLKSKQANSVLFCSAHRLPFDPMIESLLPNAKLAEPSIDLVESLNIVVATDYCKSTYVYQ